MQHTSCSSGQFAERRCPPRQFIRGRFTGNVHALRQSSLTALAYTGQIPSNFSRDIPVTPHANGSRIWPPRLSRDRGEFATLVAPPNCQRGTPQAAVFCGVLRCRIEVFSKWLRTVVFVGLVCAFLAASVTAQTRVRDVKIRGYVTEFRSPTSFDIEDYRISREEGFVLDFENASPEITFSLNDIRGGC